MSDEYEEAGIGTAILAILLIIGLIITGIMYSNADEAGKKKILDTVSTVVDDIADDD